MPKLEEPTHPKDATDHVNVLGQFAANMAKWLQNFAAGMHAYRKTKKYQKHYDASMDALKKRRTGAQETH